MAPFALRALILGVGHTGGVIYQGRPRDFFISYSPADERWATWLAWQLENAGYRTVIQAWDFVPGTNFVDFMDRGVRESVAVIAVLSENYLASRYGTMEWQAAFRTDPAKVIPVRIADCVLEGLLATITYLDLVGVSTEDAARRELLERVGHLQSGRAKPDTAPSFPNDDAAEAPAVGQVDEGNAGSVLRAGRRTPAAAPVFPGSAARADHRSGVSVLHVAGPRFGRGLLAPDEPGTGLERQARVWADVTQAVGNGAPKPDLVVVTGDLTESGRPREVDEALAFLTGLRVLLGLESDRLVVVPGNHDASKIACKAYFLHCEAHDRRPQPPFFPKLEQYARLFGELYHGLDDLVFDIGQPWTLFPIPALRIVVAGLNSTMAATHHAESDYGHIGETQAAWFAERLRPFEDRGWLRLGVVRHDPVPGPDTSPREPALLRDADTLSRLLGERLNLVFHGPGPGGPYVDRIDGTLPVLPAVAPGQAEIVQFSAVGLDRFAVGADRSGEPARVALSWTKASAALSPEQSVADLPLEPPDDAPAIVDPHSRLLERVAEVCETRYPGARIRRIEAEPPHLLITHQRDAITAVWRVGVHVGDMTGHSIVDLVGHDPEFGSELVYRGAPPPRHLREQAASHGLRIRSFTEFQGLLDLSDYLAHQRVRLGSDRRYAPEMYVPQRFRLLERGGHEIRDDLVAELQRLIDEDHGRFVLLLGDFGRGKTFALRELTRRITESSPALLPILVELRSLDKTHSVDGLVAAHLANHGEERIDLKALRYMLHEGRVVLLFDGFDELVTRVSYELAAEHLETLLQAAVGKAKIIVASRTQHFESRAQILTAMGERVEVLRDRHILAIEEFAPAQIRAFLTNRYRGDLARADARIRLITGIQDLLGLAQNPRMLSFIADLDERRLRAAAGARQTVGAAGLYREILDSWLTYEAERTATAGTLPGLGIDELWFAVTALALRSWETGEPYLRPSELTHVAQGLVELTGSGRMSVSQSAHAIGAGSLLVRTEENLFGFIHNSVTEWLVAKHIAEQFDAGVAAPAPLTHAPLSQLTVDFLCDLADVRAARAWAESVLADPVADEVSRTNAVRVITRLRTAPGADLRGAILVGEDLSYRDMRQVDLSGADLSNARLVGAILDRAILRGARLVGARLEDASLVGADLSDADFTRARLARADLTGASAAGSRWSRTALLDVTGIPAEADMLGAAQVPGASAGIEFAPAAVGVRHGFHARHGRLPQPLAYSPDGGTLAIGSDDGGVLLCDTDTGLPLRTLQGHRARSFAVAYTHSVLISGSGDGTVAIWDVATGMLRRTLHEHAAWPWPVVLGPDGDLLATGDADGVLRVWELPAGRLRHEWPAPEGQRQLIYSLAFHGRLLAASYRDGFVRVWDAETGSAQAEFRGAAGAVFRITFAPSGDLLAFGGTDGTLALWDSRSRRVRQELPGHRGQVYALAFHPTLPLLASGDTEGGLRVWDVRTGEECHRIVEHRAAIYWLAFDPAGELLASGDSAGLLCLSDGATGELRRRITAHTGSIWPFVFRPDGRQLAVTDDQFTTRLWDPTTGGCKHVLTGHGRQVRSVSFNADGTQLATCGNDGVVRLWNPVTGKLNRRLAGSEDRVLAFESARFSATRAHQLATVGNDGRLSLFDLDARLFQRHINVESAPVWAMAFDPTDTFVATANDDDTVTIWMRTTGAPHAVCAEHRGRVRSIAFDTEGTLMATGCDDSVVRLWDIESGQLVRALAGHRDRVYGVAFCGDKLASVSWDTTVRIWDVDTGEIVHELHKHAGRLWAAAVDPSGKILATAGDDLVVQLWDVGSGRHMHTLEGHERRVWSLAFDPFGGLLASGSDDGNAILWTVPDAAGADTVPEIRAVLVGLPEGWAALAPDGRYKVEGRTAGQFWHVIGMSRFESGELDQYLPEVRRLPMNVPF